MMKLKNVVKVIGILSIVIFFGSIQSCSSSSDDPIPPVVDPPPTVEIPGDSNNSKVVGSSHVIPRYFFGTEDCLNEGANFLLDMGTEVIKIWYYNGSEKPSIMYPWNSNWTNPVSLVEGLDQQHYKDLFDKPFKSFVMNVASFVQSWNIYYWRSGISQAQMDQEEAEFYELTKELLTRYAGTGKTFVLQHHEGDWHTRGNTDASTPASATIHANMVKWLNARQRGVTKARDESTAQNVFVYHAAEINIVVNSMNNGQANMVNEVLPHTNLDLVSYSAYDSSLKIADNDGKGDGQILQDAMQYIKSQMPDSEAFGNNNVYIGEYGVPENSHSSAQIEAVMTNTVTVGLAESSPYIIYWQTYDNELVNAGLPVPVTSNYHVKGFWLKKPDGTTSKHYDYLKAVVNKQ